MEINPCNASGGEVDENDFVDDPKELVGKSLHFKILVPHARGLNAKYDKVCYIKLIVNEILLCVRGTQHCSVIRITVIDGSYKTEFCTVLNSRIP